MPRERAEITVKPEGVVEVVIGTGSQGQGHETSFAQLITEWLGVPIESVRLVTGDTDRVTVGGGAHSGRGMRLGRIVMHNASDEIIEKGTRIASHVLEADARRPRVQRRPLRRRRAPTARSACSRSPRAAVERNDLPEELRGPLDADQRRDRSPKASFPYGCHVCEVEVDPETGVVEIVRYPRSTTSAARSTR